MREHYRGGCCTEIGFTDQDKTAIETWLGQFPEWAVYYTRSERAENAHLYQDAARPDAPLVSLMRQAGLTCFAARWPDGSAVRGGDSISLSYALSFIAQIIGAGTGATNDGFDALTAQRGVAMRSDGSAQAGNG